MSSEIDTTARSKPLTVQELQNLQDVVQEQEYQLDEWMKGENGKGSPKMVRALVNSGMKELGDLRSRLYWIQDSLILPIGDTPPVVTEI